MKNRKLKWANIVGVMVFACALTLNIQTSFDGETSVFGIVMAQDTGGSEGEGTGSGSDGVDKCPGGSCKWSDSFGNSCSACCPTGKSPECTTFGCSCY